jgi:hypothetical protein
MNPIQTKAKVITLQEVDRLRYPIPSGWDKAAGILKGKKRIDPVAYQKKIRREWEERFGRLIKIPSQTRTRK